jgi:transcriptional regulator with XRE-family HTH domain
MPCRDRLGRRTIHPVENRRLAQELGRLLRAERTRLGLSQERFAQRAGLKRQQVARFESGRHGTTTALADAMFAALGLQLRLAVEPANSLLDGRIDGARDRASSVAAAMLAQVSAAEQLTAHFAARGSALTVPETLVDGPLAACLHGVPIIPERIDLLGVARHRDEAEAWLDEVSPALEYPIAIAYVDDLPMSAAVEVDDRLWRVRLLPAVVEAFAEVARIVRRMEERTG